MTTFERERYFFVPLNKYDMVIEKNDGTLIIPPHIKKRYLYCSQQDEKIYMLNNMEGTLFSYELTNRQVQYLFLFSQDFLKNQIYFNIHQKLLYFLSNDGVFRVFDFDGRQISEQKLPHSWCAFCFDEQFNFYVVSEWTLQIWKYNEGNYSLLKSFPIDGIGEISITSKNGLIYLTDSEENIIRAYNWDGKVVMEAITPHIYPIGQIWLKNQLYILYGGLWNEVGYENRSWQEQKPFFHPLFIHEKQVNHYKIFFTNSFTIDFYYEEHIEHPERIKHFPWVIRMKLPENDHHQTIEEVLPLGLPFQKKENGFVEFIVTDQTKMPTAFGFKARVKLKSIKFLPIEKIHLSHSTFLSVQEIEELEANHPFFNFFIQSSNDDVEILKYCRNLIYNQLYYEKNKKAINYREVWEDGYGTCGDYSSLMLIACYKNNLAAQSATGYKVPRFYFGHHFTLSAYYNHTWLEVYDEEGMHLPMESSSDDKEKNGRFSQGQFLGLDWSHIKLYNGKAFPNFISFPSHPDVHPFDVFRHPSVFMTIIDEE